MKFSAVRCTAGLVCLLAGCSSMDRNDPYDRIFPKKPNFRLASVSNPNLINRIQYDAVYVCEDYDPRNKRILVARFFPGGQHVTKVLEEFSDVSVMNTFQHAGVGYFHVEENTLTMEVFNSINFGQYDFIKGMILSNGDFHLVSSGPTRRFQTPYPKPIHLKRTRVEGLLPIEPDW